jgi:hypothetical protein
MWTYLPASIFSPATAGSISHLDSPESNPEPSVTSNGTSTVSKSSKPGSKTVSCMTRRSSGETSENSMDSPGVEEWISSLPLRPANHTVKPENCVGPETIETSSQIPSVWLAKYDQKLCMWRTCQVLMFDQRMDGQPTGQLWSENWPRSGTTVDGTLYQRKTLRLRINERGSGSWPTPTTQEIEHPDLELDDTGRRKTLDGRTGRDARSLNLADSARLWPTPVADGDRTTNYKQGGTSLGFAARWSIPTPTPSDNWTGNLESSQQSEGSMHSVTLPGFVARFPAPSAWPTPTGDDANNVTRASGDFQSLSREAQLWPTPATSQDYKPVRPLIPSEAGGTHGTMLVGAVGDRHPDHIGGKLSATWVEWLMGIPEGWSALEPLAEGAYEEWAGHMSQGTWWAEERGLPRLAEGQTDRVNRLKCLGNGVVPASGALAFITLEGE